MTLLFKGATLALALAAAGLTSGCEMDRDHDAYRGDRDQPGVVASLDFGDVAYGYNDGYWDSGHHWHSWSNADDANRYRAYQGNHYHDWNHDRDSNMGWEGN